MTANIEHRVSALGRRVTRAEEDIAGVIDTVYSIRRTQLRDGLILKAIADQMGIALPSATEIEAELERDA